MATGCTWEQRRTSTSSPKLRGYTCMDYLIMHMSTHWSGSRTNARKPQATGRKRHKDMTSQCWPNNKTGRRTEASTSYTTKNQSTASSRCNIDLTMSRPSGARCHTCDSWVVPRQSRVTLIFSEGANILFSIYRIFFDF